MDQKDNSERSFFGLFVGAVCIWMIIICIIISVFEGRPGLISKLFVKTMMVELIAIGYIFKSSPKEEMG